MARSAFPVLALAALAGASAPARVQVGSVYTELHGSGCRTVEVFEETGGTVRRCPGVAGYHLLVAEDDDRASVTVVAPGGREHPLDYWSVVTPGFSTVGPRAEWRVARRGGRGVPTSLIVRVNAYEHAEPEPRRVSYLAVARLSPAPVCVTDRIGPSSAANEQARRAADGSSRRPCLRAR
jgi:hypothetical protein